MAARVQRVRSVPVQHAPHIPTLCRLPTIRDLILHWPSRLLVWPRKGVIYGHLGEPIGAVCADGYVRVSDGRKRCLYGHRLVWEAANGPIPPRMEIDHLNGLKSDNRIANLELVTRSENTRRAYVAGRAPVGERRRQAKLTNDLVCEIRASALATRRWATLLDLDAKTVRCARRGTTWRHVKCSGGRAVRDRARRRSRIR